MSYQITRTLIVHPSYNNMIEPLLKAYVQASTAEEDCLEIKAYRHAADTQLYILEGCWKNEISYLYHIDQHHYKHFLYLASAMLLPASAYHKLTVIEGN